MSFNSKKEYIIGCITAAVGSLLDEDYYARDFENIIGHETTEQGICSNFIHFVKKTEYEKCKQYSTQPNFNEFLLSKKRTDDTYLTDRESQLIDLLFNRIEWNKSNKNAELKEPNDLYKSLVNARKKINLQKQLKDLSIQETYNQDPVTWSDDYCNELYKNLDSSISEYMNDSETDKMYFGEDLIKYYEEKIESRKGGETYSFHNKILDSLITEGPTPGHGGIIGGSTGMGKSALCLNVINDCINADIPTMYFPIEMGLENTVDRLAAIRTGYPFKEIRNIGKEISSISKEDEENILYEIASLRAHPNFTIIEDANINLQKLKNYIKRFQAKLPNKKYCLVFIDLLLMIKEFYDDGSNMAQQIERAINKLDILAKELGIHYVGVVQLNRSIEGDRVLTVQQLEKLKPTRASIKNSSALLERARWAITLFRKRYFADLYLSEEDADTIEDVAEIQLMKANDEAIGRRFADFDGPTFKVTLNETYGKTANGF